MLLRLCSAQQPARLGPAAAGGTKGRSLLDFAAAAAAEGHAEVYQGRGRVVRRHHCSTPTTQRPLPPPPPPQMPDGPLRERQAAALAVLGLGLEHSLQDGPLSKQASSAGRGMAGAVPGAWCGACSACRTALLGTGGTMRDAVAPEVSLACPSQRDVCRSGCWPVGRARATSRTEGR